MAARESSGRDTEVKGNTMVLRLARTVAGSLDVDGDTFGVDPEALHLLLEEEAEAVIPWRLLLLMNWTSSSFSLGAARLGAVFFADMSSKALFYSANASSPLDPGISPETRH